MKNSINHVTVYHLKGKTVRLTVLASGTEKLRTGVLNYLVCSIYRNVLGRPGTELRSLGLADRANGKHNFHSEILFRNFGPLFNKSRFPIEISVREEKIVFSFRFHPKFPKFWVNSKQPVTLPSTSVSLWMSPSLIFRPITLVSLKGTHSIELKQLLESL